MHTGYGIQATARRASVFTSDPSSCSPVNGPAFPGEYLLSDAYPNPFNPQTRFDLAVRQTQYITVKVFDILGRQVGILYDSPLKAFESRQIIFDA